MIKFPSIDQFKNAIRRVKDRTYYKGRDENGDPIYADAGELPVLAYRGYVKIHGTNAAVVYNYETDEITYQSRERVLSEGGDNSGFMAHMSQHEEVTRDIATQVFEILGKVEPIKVAIYGEWCGQGIMKGVAVNELPKMFVVFAVRVKFVNPTNRVHFDEEGWAWFDVSEFDIHYPMDDIRVFNIATFGNYALDIDFNRPDLAQNRMIEMTTWVEECCPVGKYFGVEGVGEGIVWRCVEPGWEGSDVWFKVKGEKHSNSKVKTLAPVDTEAVEKLNDLIDAVVTDNRLEWALENLKTEQLKPLEMSSIGDFIRTVYNDVVKEELDMIEDNGFDAKKLGSPIANRARPWFQKRISLET